MSNGGILSTSDSVAGVVRKIMVSGMLRADKTRREEIKVKGDLVSLLHIHNDASGGSTKDPGPDDNSSVKENHVRMYFKSETSAKRNEIIILIPQKEKELEPRKITIPGK